MTLVRARDIILYSENKESPHFQEAYFSVQGDRHTQICVCVGVCVCVCVHVSLCVCMCTYVHNVCVGKTIVKAMMKTKA